MRFRMSVVLVMFALLSLSVAAHAQSKPVVKPQVMQQSGPGWSFIFRYPSLSVPGALMGVRGSMGDFNNHMKQIGQQMLAEFKKTIAEYGKPPKEFAKTKSVTDAKYTVVTNSTFIVVRWDAYQMMAGAAHPVTTIQTSNWMQSQFLQLGDLFTPGSNYLQLISKSTLASLQAAAKKGGYEIISPEGAGPNAENFKAFAVTKPGLRIYFQYAQAGPGAAGNLEALVPWSVLKPALKPEMWSQIQRI